MFSILNSLSSSYNRQLLALVMAGIFVLPATLIILPSATIGAQASNGNSDGKSRAPEAIGTTLAFDDGKVVTIQYENIYFCNGSGPETSATSSPCKVGVEAEKDPVPDQASNTLEVIVPSFKGLGGITPSSASNTINGLPGSDSLFDPALGANNFSQCPDTSSSLHCINHPHFLDLVGTGVVPLPIHSHIISGHGAKSAQGGWWELQTWSVNDPRIWPDPSTGACDAGTGCLTSEAALQTAVRNGQVAGPVPTNVYLFFNVVSAHSQ